MCEHVLALGHLHLSLAQRTFLLLLCKHLFDLWTQRRNSLVHALDCFGPQEAMLHLLRRCLFQHGLEQSAVALANKRDRAAMAPSTRSAADTVEVLLELRRHVIVDHCLDAANVETAAGEVRREQKVRFMVAECSKAVQTLLLRQVAVQLGCRET